MAKMEPMEGSALLMLHRAIQNEIEDAKRNGKSVTDLIRDYKGLLDDGIITQDEFETKKNYLLGNWPPEKDRQKDRQMTIKSRSYGKE